MIIYWPAPVEASIFRSQINTIGRGKQFVGPRLWVSAGGKDITIPAFHASALKEMVDAQVKFKRGDGAPFFWKVIPRKFAPCSFLSSERVSLPDEDRRNAFVFEQRLRVKNETTPMPLE